MKPLALLSFALLSFDAHACIVKDCYDGDTCRLICDAQIVKVRLYCIDAPDMQQKPWGAQSRDYLRKRLPNGAEVQLESVTADRNNRRTVGIVSKDGVSINLQMVRSGMAAVYPQHCADLSYSAAEVDAQDNNRGIWRQRGLHQTPWRWRAHLRR